MKKRTFIASVVAGEAMVIALTLVNTYLPGKLIDALVYGGGLKRVILFAGVIAGSFFVCNTLIQVCTVQKEIWFTLKRYRNAEMTAACFANARLDRYESLIAGKRAVLGEFAERESDRKITEAAAAIVSKLCLSCVLIICMPALPVYMYLVVAALACVSAFAETMYKRLDFRLRDNFAAGLEKMHKTMWSMTKSCYAKEIRVYQLENFTEKKFDEARGELYHAIDEKNKKGVKIDLLPAIVKGIGIFAAFGFAAVFRRGSATVGDFVICASMLQSLFESTGNVVKGAVTIAGERKYEKEFEQFCGAESGWHEGSRRFDAKEEWTIEFRDVSFSYQNSREPAVEGLNLTIRKGEKIALVGENGAGKSTFVRLLTGLYKPTHGAVYINGTNLEELDLREYHKHFSVIYQDFTIFDYSIFENIKMKSKKYLSGGVSQDDGDKKELDEMAGKLGLYERIEKTGSGYDTMLSKRFDMNGIELSGGERQKLAIMRALQKKADVIVFDEPTSTMSPVAENEMYALYGELAAGKTAVYISHRMAGCRLSDRILVFRDGKIVEEGTHDALMSDRGGFYYQMFTAQAGGYGEAV